MKKKKNNNKNTNIDRKRRDKRINRKNVSSSSQTEGHEGQYKLCRLILGVPACEGQWPALCVNASYSNELRIYPLSIDITGFCTPTTFIHLHSFKHTFVGLSIIITVRVYNHVDLISNSIISHAQCRCQQAKAHQSQVVIRSIHSKNMSTKKKKRERRPYCVNNFKDYLFSDQLNVISCLRLK